MDSKLSQNIINQIKDFGRYRNMDCVRSVINLILGGKILLKVFGVNLVIQSISNKILINGQVVIKQLMNLYKNINLKQLIQKKF